MARTVLSTVCKEGSPYLISISFTGEAGSAVTPTTAYYTITDRDGNVVGSLSSVEMSGLSTSVNILLSGADTKISASAASGQIRICNVEYVYDSTLASGLTAYNEQWFSIQDLVAVS